VFFIKRRSGYQDYRKTINFYPLKDKLPNLKTINGNDLSKHVDFFMDVFGNILMFIPMPFALIWLFTSKLSYSTIFLFVVLASLSIEIIQYLFNKGVSDIDDIFLNTIGGSIGLIVFHYSVQIKKAK
jgi:glycopeptide antibiotics resistance protein